MKLVTADLPPEVLFLRGVAASRACACCLSPWGLARHFLSPAPRALLRPPETLSVLCYIVALARLPIADAIATPSTAPLILILGVAFSSRAGQGGPRRLVSASLALFWLRSRGPAESRPRLCSPSHRRC